MNQGFDQGASVVVSAGLTIKQTKHVLAGHEKTRAISVALKTYYGLRNESRTKVAYRPTLRHFWL